MAATSEDLPALGEADQADVGDDLELEGDGPGLALLAQQGEAGCLAAGRGEGGVAEAAATAAGRR